MLQYRAETFIPALRKTVPAYGECLVITVIKGDCVDNKGIVSRSVLSGRDLTPEARRQQGEDTDTDLQHLKLRTHHGPLSI